MKKATFVFLIMVMITTVVLTGCSGSSKDSNSDLTMDELNPNSIILNGSILTHDEIASLRDDYISGKISKEYYEEKMYNSKTNNWE